MLNSFLSHSFLYIFLERLYFLSFIFFVFRSFSLRRGGGELSESEAIIIHHWGLTAKQLEKREERSSGGGFSVSDALSQDTTIKVKVK